MSSCQKPLLPSEPSSLDIFSLSKKYHCLSLVRPAQRCVAGVPPALGDTGVVSVVEWCPSSSGRDTGVVSVVEAERARLEGGRPNIAPHIAPPYRPKLAT